MHTSAIRITRRARWLRWPISTVLLCTLLLGGCAGSEEDGSPSYVAVVDAGSTGSRLYLYETEPGGTLGQIRSVFDARRASLPPLASFESNPLAAGPAGIGPLLDDLTLYLSEHHIAKQDVPVNVLGTAGMRKLGSAHATEIYASVSTAIQAAGYRPVETKTIPGESEGLYSWADVNYLEGVFRNGGRPYGLIEIGGASAQIAFVSGDTTADARIMKWRINGTVYPVLSASFLGLGTDEARKAMVHSTSPGAGVAKNACFTSGYLFGANPGDPPPAPDVQTLSGAYDYETCNGLYESVLQRFDIAKIRGVNGFSTTPFLLVGGFVEGALVDWGMPKQSPAVLEGNVRSYCQGGSWTNFLATFGQYAPQKYLQSLCANSTYASALLYGSKGASLRTDQAVPFKVEGTTSTWTRGYVLISRYAVRQDS